MKKLIIAIMLILCAFGARAEDTGITTSQAYVTTKLAEKQDAAPANNANSVMTYDSTSDDGIGAKAIYDATESYSNQKNALITAGTANAAIQNAINNEFTCANPPKCTLWNMAGIFQQDNPTPHASGKNLFNVNNIPSWASQIHTAQLINNGDGSITVTDRIGNSAVSTQRTLSQLAPDLVVGKTYTLRFNTTGCTNSIYMGAPAKFVWEKGTNLTITQDMLESTISFYACYNGETPSTATISNIQIEEGTTATAYEPYQNLYVPQNVQ